MASLVCPERF
jgi:hypothetical protein